MGARCQRRVSRLPTPRANKVTSVDDQTTPDFSEALKVWWRIGLLSFGGPAAQIALMHRELVDQRRWLSEREFLDALGFCMLLPGPEAMQLATVAGRRLHGWRGGLAAGLLFVLPGATVILVLAALYTGFGQMPLVSALFVGIQAAVVVIVIQALIRVATRTLHTARYWLIAALAFIALFVFDLPFPLVIVCAGLIGGVTGSMTDTEPVDRVVSTPESQATPDSQTTLGSQPTLANTALTILFWLLIWWLPLLLLLGLDTPLWFEIGQFFSTLATLTFGGAYAVLAWMVQDVVNTREWMTGPEMLDALGLAETTPGPLILVTQFVGFVAGHRNGGFLYGLAAAGITLWATFIPCFLWVFAGAPWLDRISANPRLRGVLSAITAAVVGVMLNLSLWFALHVFFADVSRSSLGAVGAWLPDLATWRPWSVLLSLIAAFLVFRLHWSLLRLLPVMACAGLVVGAIV